MKKETYANKLAELLGISEEKEKYEKQHAVRQGNLAEITEEQIQTFREAQGITYFLRAPALFQYKECKHCGAHYLVSRLYVAYCSYTCISKSMEELGITWSRKGNIDALIHEVYDDQEPIWIRNIEQLESALEKLISSRESLSQSTTTSHPV